MATVDHTHHPSAESWVTSANAPETDFPVQNLPFCAFRHGDVAGIGVGIGEQILSLSACARAGLLDGVGDAVVQECVKEKMDGLLAIQPAERQAMRHRLFDILAEGGDRAKQARSMEGELLVDQTAVELVLPFTITDFTDFSASAHHGRRMPQVMGHGGPPPPNNGWLPIAYGARASTVVVSGTPIPLPMGQLGRGKGNPPEYGPCETMDYELELAIVLGPGNEMGMPIPVDEAEDHIFGFALLNDWSARDIHRWESRPLGPLLGKSFNSTLAPWVVTLEALAPFRAPLNPGPEELPDRLPYLVSPVDRKSGGLDIQFEVLLGTAATRENGTEPHRLSVSNSLDLHWTAAQLVTYVSSNGAKVGPGEILGTGTVSGPALEEAGCIMELAHGGQNPLELPGGETRAFLETGDEIILRAHAATEGRRTIGFGECRGQIVPALVR